jgi:5-methylcytosine-specific restriction endonuclease McrA
VVVFVKDMARQQKLKIDRNILFILWHNQKGRCFYCHEELISDCTNRKSPHIDHKTAISKGGGNNIENLCLTCQFCNLAKNNKKGENFILYLKPFFDGKCSKKDLSQYHLWEKLNNKYGKTTKTD